MHLKVRPLSESLGVELLDLDLHRDMTSRLAAVLTGLLYDHAVLCIRRQPLSPAELAHFGEHFGRPVHHNEENLRLDGLPGVMSLSNADQRDDRQLNGGAHWHTDLIHSDDPASFTMLHAVAVPASGGGTMFSHQVAAFEALPPERQALAESITVIHCYEGRRDGSMPTFLHPLVRRHPATGRKALFGAADTGIGIVGMAPDQAEPLLEAFALHATRPEFVYRHTYQPDDIVIWDNAQLLHCAERLRRATSSDTRRIMHRVSVRGWPARIPRTLGPHGVRRR
jgi:taurine dioxygenase